MMTLQAEVVSKSLYGNHPICGPSEMAVDLALHPHHQAAAAAAAAAAAQSHLSSPQTSPASNAVTLSSSHQRDSALCLGASSLHALQNLQPWQHGAAADGRLSGGTGPPISLHSSVDRTFSMSTSALC